jgi:hypothetical protein
MVPSGILGCTFFLSFHLLDLGGVVAIEELLAATATGGWAKANVMLDATNAWVVGVGVSLPLREKMERLRLLRPPVVVEDDDEADCVKGSAVETAEIMSVAMVITSVDTRCCY